MHNITRMMIAQIESDLYWVTIDDQKHRFTDLLEAVVWMREAAQKHVGKVIALIGDCGPELMPKICSAIQEAGVETSPLSLTSAVHGSYVLDILGFDVAELNQYRDAAYHLSYTEPLWNVFHYPRERADQTPERNNNLPRKRKRFFIYGTDGSLRTGTKDASWAWVNAQGEFFASCVSTTSINRAETAAIWSALSHALQKRYLKDARVIIVSDSQTAISQVKKKLPGHPQFGRYAPFIELRGVVGHSNNLLNETADRLARGKRRGNLDHPDTLASILEPVHTYRNKPGAHDWISATLDDGV